MSLRRASKRKAKRKALSEGALPEWTPFKDVTHLMPNAELYAKRDRQTNSVTRCYANSRYEAWVTEIPNGVTYISFKAFDKRAMHDWREFWRIKNELTHEDREAIEIYPGAWRVVDTSNQYHLWVLPEGQAINLGYTCPDVSEGFPDRYTFQKGRQREIPAWMKRFKTVPGSYTGGGAYGRGPWRWSSAKKLKLVIARTHLEALQGIRSRVKKYVFRSR